MREFEVYTSIDGPSQKTVAQTIKADKFEITESGVLVFYKTPDDATLVSSSGKRFRAFNDWAEVKEL